MTPTVAERSGGRPMSRVSPSGVPVAVAPRLVALAVIALVIAASGSFPARAACTVDSQPVWNGSSGTIINCPDGSPVTGHIYKLASPLSVNSGTQSDAAICEQAFVHT